MKKWEELQLTLDNSKSDEGEAIIRTKTKNWDQQISRMSSSRICMEFDFLSIQVIKLSKFYTHI